MKILLDPNIYVLDKSLVGNSEKELEHFDYFDKVISFVSDFTSISIACSSQLYDQLIRLHDHPWNQYKGYKERSVTVLQRKLMSRLDQDEFIDLSPITSATYTFAFNIPDDSDCIEAFLKYINYAQHNNRELVIFMGKTNFHLSRPLSFTCDGITVIHNPIFDPYCDCHKLLCKLLKSSPMMHIPPTLESPFPNIIICKELDEEFLRRLHNGENKEELIKMFSTEFALRNNYEFNHRLTMLNWRKSKSRRYVFKSEGRHNFYLSSDFESGGLELFDGSTTHLGQYSFSGLLNKNPDGPQHKLYLR